MQLRAGIWSGPSKRRDWWERAVRLCALADVHKRANAFHFHEPDELAFEAALKECKRKLEKSR